MEESVKSAAEKNAETLYRGKPLADDENPASAETGKERKPVRYYRGQPIYDD